MSSFGLAWKARKRLHALNQLDILRSPANSLCRIGLPRRMVVAFTVFDVILNTVLAFRYRVMFGDYHHPTAVEKLSTTIVHPSLSERVERKLVEISNGRM